MLTRLTNSILRRMSKRYTKAAIDESPIIVVFALESPDTAMVSKAASLWHLHSNLHASAEIRIVAHDLLMRDMIEDLNAKMVPLEAIRFVDYEDNLLAVCAALLLEAGEFGMGEQLAVVAHEERTPEIMSALRRFGFPNLTARPVPITLQPLDNRFARMWLITWLRISLAKFRDRLLDLDSRMVRAYVR